MRRPLLSLVLHFGLLIQAAPIHSRPAASPGPAADTGVPKGGETLVGCLLPLSGKYAHVGERALKGILTAAGQGPGPGGYRLIVKDIGGEGRNLGPALAELLAVPGLSFIIGPIPSSYAAAAAEQAGRKKIPMIVFPASESESRGGPYVVEFFYSLEEQTKAISSYAARDLGARTFGILYPETGSGRELAGLFKRAAAGSGGKIVYEKSYPPGETDLPGETDGASASAGLILRLKQNPRLSDVLFLGPATWNSPLFLKLAGDQIDGFVYRAVYTDFFHFGDGDWARFGKDFETRHGEKPGSFEYLIYSGVSLMLKAADGDDGDGRSFLESLERLASSPEYKINRAKTGGLQISPIPRILSVSRGEIIEIMKVK